MTVHRLFRTVDAYPQAHGGTRDSHVAECHPADFGLTYDPGCIDAVRSMFPHVEFSVRTEEVRTQ